MTRWLDETVLFNNSLNLISLNASADSTACTFNISAQMIPLVQLVPKSGVQVKNVPVIIGGSVRISMGAPGQLVRPFALAVTQAQGSNLTGWLFWAPFGVSGGVGCRLTDYLWPCLFDSNLITDQGHGGNGLPVAAPLEYFVDIGLIVGAENVTVPSYVDFGVVLEEPLSLTLNGPEALAGISFLLSTLFLVPASNISTTLTMTLVTGDAPTVVWNANNNTLVGNGTLNYPHHYQIFIPVPPRNISWLFVFTSYSVWANCTVNAWWTDLPLDKRRA